MQVNALESFNVLVDKKDFIFKIMDQTQPDADNLSALDYITPRSDYIRLLNIEVNTKTKEEERKKVAAALGINNLLEVNFISSVDSHRDMIYWKKCIFDTFALLDTSRLNFLSDTEFNDYFLRLEARYKELQSPEVQNNFDILKQNQKVLFTLLNDIHGRMKENIDSLKSKVGNLYGTLKNNTVVDIDSAKLRQLAFREMQKLYDQIIIPTLQFLNEGQTIRGHELSPMSVINHIIALFNSLTLHQVAENISSYKNLIQSYYKDIELISKKAERYIRLNKKIRAQNGVLDKLFNDLNKNVEQLNDGRLNRLKITPKIATFCRDFEGFINLSPAKNEALIQFAADKAMQNFLFQQKRYAYDRRQEDSPTSKPNITISHEHVRKAALERERIHKKEAFYHCLEDFSYRNHDYLYENLHLYLKHHFSEYQLPYLIDALVWFKTKQAKIPLHKRAILRYETNQRVINFKGFAFQYYPIYLEIS